ncbi:hypothetical protein GCM10023091_24740 [Ravibacter arvi]|uniref:Uncharacterized protein n=1 Tax=Ravibacter arvi TaxID=2051041 RepID=A0ABP8M246_9BACT
MNNTSEKKVDVCVLFYGKAYNTIVTIKSLLHYSGQYIDTIYLIHEKMQPHNDVSGFFKVLDVFRDYKKVVYKPAYFYGLGGVDYERAKNDDAYRWSLPFQYALEHTDKKYLLVLHNDVLFHGDVVGSRMAYMNDTGHTYAGIGSLGQCWNCPLHHGQGCNGYTFQEHKVTAETYYELANRYPDLRRLDIGRRLVENGRVFPLPECRMNEHAALINTAIYRKECLPEGDSVCFGAVWDGADLGTVWFYQMVNKGYAFKQVILEDHGTHSPFNYTGSGVSSYSDRELYDLTERDAKAYFEQHYYPLKFGLSVRLQSAVYAAYYTSRRWAGKALLRFRKIFGMI